MPPLSAVPSSPPPFGVASPAGPDVPLHLQRLLDVYGALLTEHQREACRLRLDEDWSFTELGEALGVSRAGAHDLVRRALAQLTHLEDRLGLAAELTRRDTVEAELRARLVELGAADARDPVTARAPSGNAVARAAGPG